MNARTWTLGILVGLMAAGDWFETVSIADDPVEVLPKFSVGGVEIRGADRDVEKDGKAERRAFLVFDGRGAGSVKIRCTSLKSNPMARMMPIPEVVWTRDVAFDTSKAAELDLCALPARVVEPEETDKEKAEAKRFMQTTIVTTIEASEDGESWTPLLVISEPEQSRLSPGNGGHE